MGTEQLTFSWMFSPFLYVVLTLSMDQFQLTPRYNTLHSEMLRFLFEDEQSLKSCAIAIAQLVRLSMSTMLLYNWYIILRALPLSHAAKSNS